MPSNQVENFASPLNALGARHTWYRVSLTISLAAVASPSLCIAKAYTRRLTDS